MHCYPGKPYPSIYIDNADTNINNVSFTDQWVENNRDLWNHHNTEGSRTTNHLEGWHHKLKNQVKHPHPNIYNLIKLIISQQSTTEIRLIQYAAGRENPEKEKVCTYRQLTSYTERTPDQWSFYTRRVCRFRFHLLHLGYRNQWLFLFMPCEKKTLEKISSHLGKFYVICESCN